MTGQDKPRQDETRPENTREDKTENKRRQEKGREGKRREGKGREGKGREEKCMRNLKDPPPKHPLLPRALHEGGVAGAVEGLAFRGGAFPL